MNKKTCLLLALGASLLVNNSIFCMELNFKKTDMDCKLDKYTIEKIIASCPKLKGLDLESCVGYQNGAYQKNTVFITLDDIGDYKKEKFGKNLSDNNNFCDCLIICKKGSKSTLLVSIDNDDEEDLTLEDPSFPCQQPEKDSGMSDEMRNRYHFQRGLLSRGNYENLDDDRLRKEFNIWCKIKEWIENE